MNIIHVSVPYVGTLQLSPFSTAVVFGPEELYLVEGIVAGMLEAELTDESRHMLTALYEHVRITHTPQEVQ